MKFFRECFLRSLVFLILTSTWTVAGHSTVEQKCRNDNALQIYLLAKAWAEDPNQEIFWKSFGYASLAEHLSQRIQNEATYCGFTRSNVLFLIRQAANDIKLEKPKHHHQPLNSRDRSVARPLVGIVSMTMGEFFYNGSFGLPKDEELSTCWSNALGLFSMCELRELQKYGKIHNGIAPKGWIRLRK